MGGCWREGQCCRPVGADDELLEMCVQIAAQCGASLLEHVRAPVDPKGLDCRRPIEDAYEEQARPTGHVKHARSTPLLLASAAQRAKVHQRERLPERSVGESAQPCVIASAL